MNQCKNCGKDISDKPRNRFCSHSCAAATNNKGVRRHGKEMNSCEGCGKDTRNCRFCSHDCRAKNQRKEAFERIRNGDYDSTWSGNQTLRAFLFEDRGYKCGCCGLTEWMGKPIPLSVHHKDGDAANNAPTNIDLLCFNCHGLTPNYGRKNKNGRRKHRYTPS
jgi:hypothetical protein